MHLPNEIPPENCPSCGAKFKGKYCHKCGEKSVTVKDFQLEKYARMLAAHFTHADSKLLRSLWLLISRPGFLSAEYVAGRRNLYAKPLQLFLLLNLLFFVFFGDTDVLAPRLKYVYYSGYILWTGDQVKDIADAYALKNEVEINTAIHEIDARISGTTKAFLYLLVPVCALIFFGLFYRQNPFFLCHLILATHWLAFLLLLIMVGGSLLAVTIRIKGIYLLWGILAMLIPFHLVSTHRFFGGSWPWLFIKMLVFFAAFVLLFLFYRNFMLLITMYFIKHF